MELKVHEFQMSILRELLFKPNARFRDLKKFDVTNDHFSFHINHLLEQELIIKENGRYSLTDIGKEFAGRMDTDSLHLEKQAKLGVSLNAVREVKGETQYLIHKRLKSPFYGWYGSHSGKIRWRESPQQTAKREFKEETGLSGEFNLKGIVHYHHFHIDGRFLEDKYFWVFKVDNVKGKLKEKVPEGENIWMGRNEIRKLKNIFATLKEIEEVINSDHLVYLDRIRTVNEY